MNCPVCAAEAPAEATHCPACGRPFPADCQTLSGAQTALLHGGLGALLGREVAGYRLEKRLGKGGMGEVFLAEQLKLGRRVALKVLARQGEAERSRFEREARLLASLDHPHIVPIHDVFAAHGQLCIAMAYVPDSLADRIARERHLPPLEVQRLARQAALALDAANRQGIVHRDVKPGNILLTRDGDVRLADFGLARALAEEGLTGSQAILGTPAFMPPEQWQDGRRCDHRSDLYALGCTLYMMLTGRPPFVGPTLVDFMRQHLSEQAPSLHSLCPDAPQHLVGAVERLLAKDPGARFAHGRQLAETLEGPPESAASDDASIDCGHALALGDTVAGSAAPVRPRAGRRGVLGWLKELFAGPRGGMADPQRARELLRQAWDAFEAGRGEAAEHACDEAVALAPALAFAYLVRAMLAAQSGQAARAAAACTAGLALNASDAERAALLHTRGVARTALDDHAGARADLDEALRYAPDRVDTYCDRARCLLHLGDARGARRDCSAALALEQSRAEAWFTRGVARAIEGRHAEAREDFCRATDCAPSDPTPKLWRVALGGDPGLLEGLHHGLAYLHLGTIEPSALLKAAAEPAEHRNERLCVAYMHIGLRHEQHGRPEQARRAYQACLQAGSQVFERAWARARLVALGS